MVSVALHLVLLAPRDFAPGMQVSAELPKVARSFVRAFDDNWRGLDGVVQPFSFPMELPEEVRPWLLVPPAS